VVGRVRGLAPALALVAAGCDRPPQEGGDAATGEPTVEMFAPGVVSTALPEFATSFSAGGDTVFFNRTSADRSTLDLLVAERTSDGWSEARLFEPTAGFVAIDPFAYGDRLYFSSDLPFGDPLDTEFGLWFIERVDGGWSLPRALPPPIRSDSSDVFNSLARNGTLVFSSRRNGGRQIYESRRLQVGGWSDPRRIDLGPWASASNPAIDPDGRLLVVALSEGEMAPDLFVSCRSGEGWMAPQRLADPINSDFADFAPGFGVDHLYFTSERPGIAPAVPDGIRPPGDIYRTPLEHVLARCP